MSKRVEKARFLSFFKLLVIVFEGSIWFNMQVVLSLDSTKVTGVSGDTISDLYYPYISKTLY